MHLYAGFEALFLWLWQGSGNRIVPQFGRECREVQLLPTTLLRSMPAVAASQAILEQEWE
jgi:hypothetical protein